MKLKRSISTAGILLAAVSATIGSGWLFGSLFAAQMAGPAAILAWIIGAVAVIFVALCFAEITTLFPVSGAIGIVPYFTHGSIVSFALSLMSWLAFAVIVPIEVQAVLQYMTNMYPWLMEKVGNELHLTTKGYLCATILTATLMAINIIGTNFMAKTNAIMTLWKLIVPILVIIIFLASNPHFENLTSAEFAPAGLKGLLMSLSVGGIVLAFNGFQPAIALAGEAKNPQRSVPIAIIGSILICMVIYCLLQFCFIVAIPPESIKNGWNTLSFNGDAGPFAGLAILLGFGFLAGLLYIDALVSPLACGLVFLAAAARVSYAMSKKQQLPKFFQKLTKKGIPLWSLLFSFAIAESIFYFFHSWQTMAAFYAGAICLCNVAIPISLYTLRLDFSSLHRPYKVTSYKIVSIFAFYISNLMLYWCGFEILLKLDCIIIIGVLIYLLIHFFNNIKENSFHKKQFWQTDFKGSLWFSFYLFSMTMISYFGNFGGKNYFQYGSDFLAIAIVTIISLYLAIYFRLKKHVAEDRMQQLSIIFQESMEEKVSH